MKRKTILILLLAALAALLLLASCKGGNNPAESGTEGGTDAETEAVTLPRFDYMENDVAPDVEIDREEYVGITLTIPDSLKVDEATVMDYIDNLRFQAREAVNGTAMVKDQAMKLGDDAYIYYKGFLNGEEFDGGSNWNDAAPYKLGLGSGSFIPGFEEGLIGVIPNQTTRESPAEITVTFPENYTASLAGKEVVFHVYVEYAVQYALPEYDKEFVIEDLEYETQKEFYASDKAILSEFEDFVEDYLVENRKKDIEDAKVDAVWNNLMEKAECKSLPQMEIDYYIATYMAEAKNYFDYYTSAGNSEFMKLYPTVEDFYPAYFGFAEGTNWTEELNKVASRNVKQDMLTHAIAELEGLETITREEFDARVQYWVDYYKSNYYQSITKEQIIERMGEDALRESALIDKVDKWLVAQVTFTYADGTPLVSTTENGAETETSEG